MCFILLFSLAGCSDELSEHGQLVQNLYENKEVETGDSIATIETSMGTIKLRLFPDKAPITVKNFTELSNSGYYDGITFHRVIEDFMIQGGDPTATGTGGESIYGCLLYTSRCV